MALHLPSRPALPVALVGYGVRGRQWHAVLNGLKRWRITAVVDSSPAAAQAAREAGLPVVDSISAAAAAAAGGVAIVATPPSLHERHVVECVRSGLHVLVEKPAALSVRGARRIEAAAVEGRRRVVVGQNFRYRPTWRAVQRLVAAGAIGPVCGVTVTSGRPRNPTAGDDDVELCGTLWDVGIHHLDAVRRRFDDLPTTVTATALTAGEGVVDHLVELVWASGARVLYRHREGSELHHYGDTTEGTNGVVAVTEQRVTLISTRHRPRRVRVGRATSGEREILSELSGLADGRASTLDIEENLGSIAILEAACASLREGRGIALADVMSSSASEK